MRNAKQKLDNIIVVGIYKSRFSNQRYWGLHLEKNIFKVRLCVECLKQTYFTTHFMQYWSEHL